MSKVTREELIHAIYGQESSHGAADTSKENYAQARGPMQVTLPTFEGLKKQGLIPAEYDHANPAHTKEAGEKLVGMLYDKYDGDARKVAAAYYAGEKAVKADGTITDYIDRKNPKAPTTLQYVADIEKRLTGTSTVASASKVQAPEGGVPLASWDLTMPSPLEKQAKAGKDYMAAATPAMPGSAPLTGAGVVPESARLAASTAMLQAEQTKVDETGVLDVARAKFMHEGVGPIIAAAVRPEFTPSPGGFTVDPKELSGLNEDEQEFMREAVSPEHLDRIKWEIAEGREQRDIASRRGLGANLLASAIAGAPVDYVTGVGLFRAFSIAKVASGQLAAQGRTGAALASAAAENAAAAAVVTGASSAFDKHASGADIAIDMAASALLGPIFSSPSILRESREGARMAMQKLADDAAARVQGFREQAVANLGPNATPEQLTLEAQRLESNGIRQTLAAGTAEVPANRRLIETEDDIRTDTPEATTQADAEAAPAVVGMAPWNSQDALQMRLQVANTPGSNLSKAISRLTGGLYETAGDTAHLGGGVHMLRDAAEQGVAFVPVRNMVTDLAKNFLPPEVRVLISTKTGTPPGATQAARGEIVSAGNVHIIGIKPRNDSQGMARTAAHEVGHVVFHHHARDIPPSMLAKMMEGYDKFRAELAAGDPKAREKRYSVTSVHAERDEALKMSNYEASFDEYAAEQFVKHIEREAQTGAAGIEFTASVRQSIVNLVKQMLEFFGFAKAKGYLGPDEGFEEFFNAAMNGELKAMKRAEAAMAGKSGGPGAVSAFDEDIVVNVPRVSNASQTLVEDPVAIKHGLSLLPVETPTQQAEVRAITALYKKAEAGGYVTDEKRLSKLLDTAVFQGAQGTANVMLRSENPVVRMVAAELLESASGAGGRRSSAAIAKHLNERAYLGNALNEVQDAYRVYRTAVGDTVAGDFFNGRTWDQFNRRVSEEIEARRPGAAPVDSPPAVKRAADVLEAAYDRMRVAQVQTKTVGWASLPESSVGYMPHKMSPEKVRAMTAPQAQALHSALVDQFIQIEGFDITFSENLARRYMDRVRQRALGGYDAPVGVHQVGAADIVEDALEAMGMERHQVIAMMKKYMAGSAGHTKKRLKLDLNAEHDLGDGTTFKLMDLFETDQFRLLRAQAQRVSGEVALARHGVMGKSGLKLLRRAMEFGEDGKLATARELEAFDQVAAEFMGEPFGTQSKFVDRAMQVNSLARLGGMGFTQFAEAINGIFHVGAMRTLESVSGMVRLRSEIKALARGERVEGSILRSIEEFGGAQFGTDSYKTVFPFDNQALQYQTYGKETVTAADRLLRGAGFVQGRLSFWRSIHGAQQRGMAEQVVRKAAAFLKDGKNDVALRDMGISDELMGKLRADLDNIAKFDGDRLTDFDITMASDKAAAEEFVQAVHRGVSQIIQGTFIGEQGRWAHDGMMRLLTQFRTFGLTSIDKQWSRQVGNVGTAKVLGMMLGAMTLAAPIYMSRTYLASIGREDQEDYLDRQLAPAQIARATLNYIAMSGLAGDFLDAATAVTGVGKVTGGRTGASSEFVGNVVAPAAGLADDLWRGLQNTKEGTDPTETMKALPFSKLPFLVPAINALGD